MRVQPQVLRPGVQHQSEAADAAQPARVGGELSERGRRALHQRVVHPARVCAGQRVELVRQREHQVAVRHVEQLAQARGAPGVALAALALRAVAVATRMPVPLLGPAVATAQQLPAQCRRATTDDGAPHARPRRAQRVCTEVGRAEVAQHLGQRGGHAKRLSAGLGWPIRAWASGWARALMWQLTREMARQGVLAAAHRATTCVARGHHRAGLAAPGAGSASSC